MSPDARGDDRNHSPGAWFDIYVQHMPIGPAGHVALGVDPDGNMFGLHSIR